MKALLSKKGIDVNKENIFYEEFKTRALTMAAEKKNVEIVKALLKADGIDVNLVDGFGRTALMYASQSFETEIKSQIKHSLTTILEKLM